MPVAPLPGHARQQQEQQQQQRPSRNGKNRPVEMKNRIAAGGRPNSGNHRWHALLRAGDCSDGAHKLCANRLKNNTTSLGAYTARALTRRINLPRATIPPLDCKAVLAQSDTCSRCLPVWQPNLYILRELHLPCETRAGAVERETQLSARGRSKYAASSPQKHRSLHSQAFSRLQSQEIPVQPFLDNISRIKARSMESVSQHSTPGETFQRDRAPTLVESHDGKQLRAPSRKRSHVSSTMRLAQQSRILLLIINGSKRLHADLIA